MKNIVIVFGGCSPEYGVSLQSAYSIIKHMDKAKYNPVLIGITREGAWFRYYGEIEAIPEDTWQEQKRNPAILSPDRRTHGILEFTSRGVEATRIDAAMPVLHGSNGEDGTIQGLIELAGIPLIGCGSLASALCMDKDRAHKIVSLTGIRVPQAVVIRRRDPIPRNLSYPGFVKPVRAGSSFGISKVFREEELEKAVELAFRYDDEVIIEEAIEGREVGCAVMGNEELVIGQVDEIELERGFFDYEEKYTLKTSKIHMPARIDEETADRIRAAAAEIYRALGCTGFARVDMFLTPDKEIVFNEVNTIPGFTVHSRFPGMLQGIGMSFDQIVDRLLEDVR